MEYFSLCNEGNEHLVIERIKRVIERGKEMTPQEELFAKFFNGEKADPKVRELIAAKDMIGLRARRDELSAIAFEARARATSIDDEIRSLNGGSGPHGFIRSINTDDTTSNAINAINTRNKRIDKKEKIRQNLLEMGVDPAEVDKIMSNKGIRDLSRPQATLTGKDENKAAKPAVAGGFDWDKIISEAKAKESGNAPVHNDKDKIILTKEPETPKSNESGNNNPFSFLNKE